MILKQNKLLDHTTPLNQIVNYHHIIFLSFSSCYSSSSSTLIIIIKKNIKTQKKTQNNKNINSLLKFFNQTHIPPLNHLLKITQKPTLNLLEQHLVIKD